MTSGGEFHFGFASLFCTSSYRSSQNTISNLSGIQLETHKNSSIKAQNYKNLSTTIRKNMNLCEILLDYFEAARLQKSLACKRDNPWQIDDQAVRRLHIGAYKRSPGLRYFANSGITCKKPARTERVSKSLYGTEYEVENDEDIPFGTTTMATHTPKMTFPSHKKKIEEAKAIVSMASHMVPAVFNRKEDPMKYLQDHLIKNKLTPDDIEDNLTLLFEELSNNENLSDANFMKEMQLAAKKMIYALIQKATAHYEEYISENLENHNSNGSNNCNEMEYGSFENVDSDSCREVSFLSRESTQLSDDRIQRIAEELVLSVTEQVSHSIESKVLVEINSTKIMREGQPVSS